MPWPFKKKKKKKKKDVDRGDDDSDVEKGEQKKQVEEKKTESKEPTETSFMLGGPTDPKETKKKDGVRRSEKITHTMDSEIDYENRMARRGATDVDLVEMGIIPNRPKRHDVDSDEDFDSYDDGDVKGARKQRKKKYLGELGGADVGGNEERYSRWIIFRMLLLLVLFGFCVHIITENYNLRPCYELDGVDFCLRANATRVCTTPDHTTECRTQCLTDGWDLSTTSPACRYSVVPGHTTAQADAYRAATMECFSESTFYDYCWDSTACHPDNIDPTVIAVEAVAAMAMLMAIIDIAYFRGLTAHSRTHPNVFVEGFKWPRRWWINCITWMPKISQVLFAGLFVAIFVLCFRYAEFEDACQDSETTNGEDYQFFSDVLALIGLSFAASAILLFFGSCFRFHCPFRGEIHAPAYIGQDECFNDHIDCSHWRYRTPGERCGSKSYRSVCGETCGTFVAGLVDCFFCWCLCGNCVGATIENGWKYRHYIGP